LLLRAVSLSDQRLQPPDPAGFAGKERERHRILQDSTGYTRKWEQYSRRKFPGIFFLVDSSQFPVLSGRNRSQIIEKKPKISDGHTASTFQRFPVLSCRNRPVFFDPGIDLKNKTVLPTKF
jgi:hypothetical protein